MPSVQAEEGDGVKINKVEAKKISEGWIVIATDTHGSTKTYAAETRAKMLELVKKFTRQDAWL